MKTYQQMMDEALASSREYLRTAQFRAPNGSIFAVTAEMGTNGVGVLKWEFEVNSFTYNRQTFGKMLREAQS